MAKSEGYAKIAKQKTRDNILSPMAAISRLIWANREEKSPFKPAFATSSDHSAHGRQHRRGRPDYLDPIQRAVPQIPARAGVLHGVPLPSSRRRL